ncbi:ABC transporter ATP-binding protein [Nocardioides sp. Kera G14]|uniref:ABC transporter ATP-binding protein n=1 Tax=Nocardioides sp. Kera G14 TaxID=2884264 RepID=UPI001D109867|nr:ABC transporter ATP-binding protein [Nocardioides sp. Kera G14]UDY23673.1 ABC transporter ATP-binding protein [Nocardioides sp. Kera G14]
MLEFNDVRITYGAGVIAADGISLAVGDGRAATIIGGNGAGKSTLLRAASGILRAAGGRIASGRITWDAARIDSRRASAIVREGIAHVPEGRRVFGGLTVEENLEAAGLVLRDRPERRRLVAESYERFPVLGERRTQPAGLLSGGEQQMLAICRGLMSKPRLLILDEPTLGLAPLIVTQIAESVKEIHATGTAVLLVEQNAAVALGAVEHAYVLESGRVVLEGPAAELAESDDVRKLYLGADLHETAEPVPGSVAAAQRPALARWSA